MNPAPMAIGVLSGRTVAVDANNMLWTFVTGMGATGNTPTDDDGRSIAHLVGLVNRLEFLAEHGIRSAWVFDGEQPALKEPTLRKRLERIEAAKAKGDVRGSIQLTSQEIAEAQELLSALGVPWFNAPGESDAQCAWFAREGHAWCAVTQDYDAALHGSPRTARNLSATGRDPELMDLLGALQGLALTRGQLVDIALLMGTDYNDGVKGVGPIKAVKLVREHGDLAGALKALKQEIPEADACRELFLAHPVDEGAAIAFHAPEEDVVHEMLTARALSLTRARRITNAVGRLHR